MQGRLEIAKQYLSKKYEVLQEEERSQDGGSRKSRSSTRSVLGDVEQWVDNQDLAMAAGPGTSHVPVSATLIPEVDPRTTAAGSMGGTLPKYSTQVGFSSQSGSAIRPFDRNEISSWGVLVPRSGQYPANSVQNLPSSQPTTSSTPQQERQFPHTSNHSAAISPPHDDAARWAGGVRYGHISFSLRRQI